VSEGIIVSGADAGPEIKRISDRIVELCDASLLHGRPYLLSRLGLDLGKDVQRLKLLSGRSLADFIRNSPALNAAYALVPVIGSKNVLAVVKKDAGNGTAQTGNNAVAVAPPQPVEARYNYRFWAAFAIPSIGTPRYLDSLHLVFKNIPEGEELPSGWLLIDDEYIAPKDAENRDELIKKNIDRWLKKNGMEPARFLQGARPALFAQRTLLAALLDALDQRQLQNTVLSLDVIATLASKKF